MSTLHFADTHNMAAFLEKLAELDKKKVIITETNIRRDLHLEDAEVFINQQLGDMSHHKKIYVSPSHIKKIFANMKREGKDFSGRITPLFATMLVPHQEKLGKGSDIPSDPQHTPIITQPISALSTSKPQKKQKFRRTRKNTEVSHPNDSTNDVADENVTNTSNDPMLSSEDRLKLLELMDLCTKLSERVLDLEHTKTAQDSEISKLKKRVKHLEKRNKSRTLGLKRLRKVGSTRRERNDDLMFDIGDLDNKEVVVAKQSEKVIKEVVSAAAKEASTANPVTTEKVVVKETSVPVSAATIMVSTATTTVVATPTITAQPQQRAKGIAFIEHVESTDNTQAMIEADQLLAERLQTREQDKLTEEEKTSLFMQFLEKRRKFFAAKRAEAKRNKQPTQAQ
ncbi:hypothetical protein Tco_0169353 [Tanacetum coccineum]